MHPPAPPRFSVSSSQSRGSLILPILYLVLRKVDDVEKSPSVGTEGRPPGFLFTEEGWEQWQGMTGQSLEQEPQANSGQGGSVFSLLNPSQWQALPFHGAMPHFPQPRPSPHS